MRINVTRSSMPPFEEYCKEIEELWDNRWLTNTGKKHQELQSKLEDYFNVPHVSLFTNGHTALESILIAMDFPAGSEIITTPFTFISTTNAIVRCGLKPVFCDINNFDYTIDVNKVEKLITKKTVAILPVHVYGNVCDVKKLDEIGKNYNLKIIYDAAHAFGVRYKNKSVVSYGDASMISFHATKVFNTIEGGAVCTSSDYLEQRLMAIKNFGIINQDSLLVSGNAKMNEFQAAMGICNLRYIEKEIEKRKTIVETYRNRLGSEIGIRLCPAQKDVVSNYSYFPIVFNNYRRSREEVENILKEHDIFARRYFYPLTYNHTCYNELKGARTPVAENISKNVLTLPLYSDLKKEEANYICDLILGE